MMKRTTVATIAAILTVTLVFYATASTGGGGSSDPQFEAMISTLIAEQYPAELQNSIRAHGSTDSSLGAELAKRMEESKSGDKIGVIVLLRPKQRMSSLTSQECVVGILQDRDMDVEHQYHIINGISAKIPTESIKEVAGLPDVECLYLDRAIHLIHPIEAEEPAQAGSVELATDIGEGTEERVWDEGIDGSGIVVAVIDTGIDKNHPDLYGKVIAEKNFVDDGTTADDQHGHGTHCAGIIAGTGEASGGRYKGIAPGALLMNARVLDSEGQGELSDIIAGIEWAVDNGADVISISAGGSNPGDVQSKPECMTVDAAMDAGVVVCIAAGNMG
ncbi:MAG: S8 family serine peptidase [Euryarchaeota archaeon]|nr:S8 family serine peptidase [Euryarchaeota archaeon]